MLNLIYETKAKDANLMVETKTKNTIKMLNPI